MNLTKKRWLILTACCFINLCLGSIYAWSVFATPMAEYLSKLTGQTLTNGDLAIVYTIANSVGPITMITGGWFNDKFGPKKVILVGGLMFGGGMILSGFATSVNFLIVSYGLVSGLGLGMAYGSTISSCVKFFPDKRGLIGGITTAVYGLSSVILPPIVTVIVNHSDATTAFKIIGAVFLLIVCAGSFLIEQCPADFVPDGYIAPSQNGGAPARENKDWKGMLTSPVFYVMIFLLTCGAFCGMMIISQASAVAQNMVGMSALAASTAVSILALFNALGRIVAGSLSDKLGRINTLTIACLLSIVGLICLYFTGNGSTATFYIGIAVVGICFGSFMGIYPGFTADQFGPKNNSVNYGIMFIGFALAGYFGPTIMRNVFTADNSYQRAFLIAIIFNIISIALCFIYRVVNKKTTNN
ncbi:oxalate/formate antiporter [Lachnospiraceae bacterium KM106-2]|nr:oxalate/formate antiporter [Lachnospiraceae bacterium KM106-2]